jgi:hypothetical protein
MAPPQLEVIVQMNARAEPVVSGYRAVNANVDLKSWYVIIKPGTR